MRKSITPFAISVLLAANCTAFGAGGGSAPSGSPSMQTREAPTPESQARNAYNAGVRLVEKADQLIADAVRQTDERKQKKARAKAEQAYSSAMKKFASATELQPSNYQAWNYLGYTNRKVGNYEAALSAYDRALNLKPGFAEAIEYRGHAYLRLDRLSEAKDAYLTLFSGNRKLAATLLTAMQEWVGEHRAASSGKDAAGVDGAMVESFASWVNERSTIAGQTASLTREGAASAWH
jgi:tetratricopeptide (TPR) repeat protein